MTTQEIRLTQVRVHKSIKGLQPTTLPAFTLLTGKNGSGKSHLLEAIKNGAVSVNVAPNFRTEVQLHDWNSLVPNDVGVTNISQVHQHRDWFVNQLRSAKEERRVNVLDILAGHGIDNLFSSRPWDALSYTTEDLTREGLSAEKAKEVENQLRSVEESIKSKILRDIGQDDIKRKLVQEFINSGKKIVHIGGADFDNRAFSSYGANLFQHSFGELFFGYFEKVRANKLGRLDEEEGIRPRVPPLSDDEFRRKHGEPPWDFVNHTLMVAGLDFRIDRPVEHQATEYLPTLTKVTSGDELQFSSLSSGEKVLMSFALCLYNTTDKRQNIVRPKLILLDEIDAPLHPSMARTLVKIINEVLVDREEIPVIMVTHSPSTVAVSPDQSVHLLEPLPTRIKHESKRRAVSTLTSEIPTMSIDFSGRRQIFVESDLDAARYQTLYQILAPSLDSERSLSFIGVGYANHGTGSAQVISTVNQLAEAGNVSVLGLIDWDTKNLSSKRVFVLAEKSRYAIENCLLDPILVAAAILHDKPGRAEEIGLLATDTFAALSSLSANKLQAVSDAVQERLALQMRLSGSARKVSTAYASGISLKTDQRYLFAQGHDLEAAIKEAFPELRRFHANGALLNHMVNVILRNHPLLAPGDILEVFKRLCDAEL